MASRAWFITGISSGIGRHLAEQLLGRGDRVAGTARRIAAADDLRRYGDQLWLAPLDVTDPAAVRRVAADALAALGRIDVVVSNAGYGLYGAAEEVTDDQIRHQVDTNLIGSISVVRAFLPHLRAQGGGRIIQVSSAGGQTTYPGFGLYHATKWGIEGFCQTLALEVAPFGIGVTIAEPGATRTGFAAGMVSPPTLPEYDATTVGDIRRAVSSGAFAIDGDPAKVARAMIDSVDVDPAPLRLTLGADTFRDVRRSLADRLALVDAQRELAHSTGTNDAATAAAPASADRPKVSA